MRRLNILGIVLRRNLKILPDLHIIHPFVNGHHKAIEFILNYTNYKYNLLDNNVVKCKGKIQIKNFEILLNSFKNINILN